METGIEIISAIQLLRNLHVNETGKLVTAGYSATEDKNNRDGDVQLRTYRENV
jgi:hypothetical protein